MTARKSLLAPYLAAVLLVVALFTIRLMRWLYNRRVVSYPVTRHFFGAAHTLQRWAKQLRGL